MSIIRDVVDTSITRGIVATSVTSSMMHIKGGQVISLAVTDIGGLLTVYG